MAQVKVDATGEVFEAPDDQIGVLAAKGGFSFPAGTQVPLRNPDGSVTAVPVEQYWQNPNQYTPAQPQDIATHQAKLAETQAAEQEAALDAQYGNGLANLAQAHGEAALRGVSLGLSDALLSTAGVDPTGLRERAERNAFTGATEFAGAVIPAVVTGGESAVAQAGVKGAVRAAAAATPTALAERVGAKVGAEVAKRLGEGFSARMATGTARLATEGALSGIGGEISARAMDDRALLDAGTMDEYLMAAGQGALIGGAMGGAGVGLAAGAGKLAQAGKVGLGKLKTAAAGAFDSYGAPVREAESALTAAAGEGDALLATANAADYDANVRAAQQRLDSLTLDDVEVRKAQTLREAARAKLAASAPTTEVLPGAAGGKAHEPLAAIGARVKAEAKALGVEDSVADDAWARIENGKREFEAADATHAETTKRVAGMLDEMEAIKQRVDDNVGLARRNETMRGELARDRTAAPPEQFVGALRAQHDKMQAKIQEFLTDPDGQVASKARALNKHFVAQAKDLAALDLRDATSRADAFEILDQTNRLMGSARKRMGKRSGVETLSRATQELYEETRQILKNPEIVGNRVAEISGRQKANYTEMFSVDDGYTSALLRDDAGGERSLSGFETAARGDTAKVGNLLKRIDTPEAQLDLELIGRGIDTHATLMQGFLDDLKPGGQSAADLVRYRELSKQIADDLVTFRSKRQLAKEFESLAAPGLKEVEGLDVKIASAQEKASEKFAAQQAKLQDAVDAATARSAELRARGLDKAADAKDRLVRRAQDKLDAAKEKAAESGASLAVEAAMPVLGAAVLGPAGAVVGAAVGKVLTSMATPVIRSVARNALGGMLKAQEKASQFKAVHEIGSRVAKAAAGFVDRMHKAGPYRAAARTIAMRAPRDTQEEFDRTMSWVNKAGAYDQRAAYLSSIAPAATKPQQMRPDLDKINPVHPLAQRKFLRAARAATDPAGAFEDLANGVQSKEAGDAVKALYPRLLEKAASHIMDGAISSKSKPSMRAQQELSLFLGTPVHFTMAPDFVAAVQATYQAAAGAGQSEQDMLQSPEKARQINSKASQMQATQTQRLEAGIT